MSVPKWKSLQQAAELARRRANHAKAIELYTQALARARLPWEARVSMTMACAYSYKMLGQFTEADALLSALAEKPPSGVMVRPWSGHMRSCFLSCERPVT